jgi:hypothetical protein
MSGLSVTVTKKGSSYQALNIYVPVAVLKDLRQSYPEFAATLNQCGDCFALVGPACASEEEALRSQDM